MRKSVLVLAALFVLQAGLAVGLNLDGGGLARLAPGTPLLAFEASSVERLTIEDGEGKSVTLARTDDGWVLPDAGDFPADGTKVEELLTDLEAAELGQPVATSKGALERFRVAEGRFERRLQFAGKNGSLATIYLGTSQGTNEVHARRDEDAEVRRIAFSSWRAPAGRDSWIERTMLQIEAEEIAAISWDGIRIERQDGENADAETDDLASEDTTDEEETTTWLLASAAEEIVLPEEPVTKLVDRLASLRFSGLLPEEERAAYEEGEAAVAFELLLRGGETRTYRLLRAPGEGEEEDDFALAVEGYEPLLKMARTTARNLIQAAEDPAFRPGEGDATAGSQPREAEMPRG